MSADITLVGKYIAGVLQAALGDAATVEFVYEFTEDLAKESGKKVYIFPLQYANQPPETRKEDAYLLQTGLVFLERYEGTDGNPVTAVPTTWVDDRIAFGEERIFNLFANPRYIHTIGSFEYWSQEATVNEVYNHDKLKQEQTYWSEMVISFRTVRKPADIFVDANIVSVVKQDTFKVRITLDQPTNFFVDEPLPHWDLDSFAMSTIEQIDDITYDASFIHMISAGQVLNVAADQTKVRTYTAGYVKEGSYPIDMNRAVPTFTLIDEFTLDVQFDRDMADATGMLTWSVDGILPSGFITRISAREFQVSFTGGLDHFQIVTIPDDSPEWLSLTGLPVMGGYYDIP